MNKLFLVLILSAYLISCQQKEDRKHFTISAKINGLDNGFAQLKRYNGEGFEIIDSVAITNGALQFYGSVTFPELYRIYIIDRDEYIPLFVDNSIITVTADTGKIFYAQVSGSESDSIYKMFCRQIDSIDITMQPVVEEYKKAEIIGDSKKSAYLQLILDSSFNNQVSFTKEFVEVNSSSPVAVFVLYKYLTGELGYDELKYLSLKIDTVLKHSTYFEHLLKQLEIMQRTEIGQKAIDFSLTDTSGTSVQLKSFYGKYVLIDFWASWCPPCREENPNVVKAFKKYANKGFTVLGISFDSKHDKWLKAIHDDNLTWTHISDLRGWENAVGSLYGIRSIPSNLLIGPDGIILAKNLRGKALLKKLDELLK